MARDLQRRHNFHRGIFGVPAGPFRKELVGSHRALAISLGCQNVPVGAENAVTSCDLHILVYESAEPC